jgi:hypothetical protein
MVHQSSSNVCDPLLDGNTFLGGNSGSFLT